MRSVPDLDRVCGALLGQCLGDALGFPVEGHPPETCAAYVSNLLRKGHAGSVGRPPFPFGQYTDDSQLARELLCSLVEGRGFDPLDYGARIAALFSEGRVVGRGRATEEAAARLERGWPWWDAGAKAPNAGNGGAMRAAPAGIWHWDDLRQAASLGHVQAALTHHDPRACAGAAAIAVGTALSLTGDRSVPLDGTAFCTAIAARVRPIHAGFADSIADLGTWAEVTDSADALVRIEAAAALNGGAPDGWRGISPFVVPSVLYSLYAFLRAPDSAWDAICLAISVGGDVDTTAAMTGALVGARTGLSRLPSQLTVSLNDQGTWTQTQLIDLARQAHAMLVERETRGGAR